MRLLERVRTNAQRCERQSSAKVVLQEMLVPPLQQEPEGSSSDDGSRDSDESEADEWLVPVRQSSKVDHRVWRIECVFTAAECAMLLQAVAAAVSLRGWNRQRHYNSPTTDLPLSALGHASEAWVRATLFQKVIRPLMPLFMVGSHCLPEALSFRDVFIVRYGCAPGEQRELPLHTDGSIFSFNVLLNEPSDFDGGGTFFELSCQTIKPPRGGAVGHSGDVRHSGVAITRGERYILVGFVGCAHEAPYSLDDVRQAEFETFLKFGHGAWDRKQYEPPQLVPIG